MPTTLIVAGAPVADPARYESLVAGADLVIAADSGADLCAALGRVPDVFAGDADSVSETTLGALRSAGVPLELASADKDVSDLDLALTTARDRGLGNVIVTAAWGGRADHMLAVVGSLFDAADLAPQLVEPGLFEAWVMSAAGCSAARVGEQGRTLSLLAGPQGATVSVSGTRWTLDHADLPAFSRTGLSNMVVGPAADILVHSGAALLILVAPDRDAVLGTEG